MSHFKRVSGNVLSSKRKGDEDIWFPIPNENANRNPQLNINIPQIQSRVVQISESNMHGHQEPKVEAEPNLAIELDAELNPDTIVLSSDEAGDVELRQET